MQPDGVLVFECLSLGVQGVERHQGGLQRIDPLMRRTTGVRRLAQELYVLYDVAVACPTDGELALFRV